jgi:hypothetical protein
MATPPTTAAFAGFEAFWPHYLGEHADPRTRAIHIAGTITALAGVALSVVAWSPWWALGGVALAYALAWTSHATVERNHPATFRHPWWSFRGDLRMTRLWLSGRLEDELRRHGL